MLVLKRGLSSITSTQWCTNVNGRANSWKCLAGRTLNFQQERGKRTHHVQVGENRSVAYKQMPGTKQPTIVHVPGLHSYAHMNGMTAKSILRFCDLHDYSCIIYDAEGMGASQELADRRKVLFSHWIEDVVTVVKELTEGPVILTACSLGGWLSLVAAQRLLQERSDIIHGMVLWAPALNYVYPYYKRHKEQLPQAVQRRLDQGEVHILSHHYGDALLKKDFAEDSLQHEVDLTKPFDLPCPVRLIHGLQDKEVNPLQTKALAEAITSPDVDLVFRKSGTHQLENPPDIELFLNTLDRMMKSNPID